MKAICVDDEPLVLQLTLSLCRELPALDEVEGFAGPEEALDWLEENTVDLAFLDIDMPGMNGITLAAKIREKSPGTAIIFLTGYAEYAVDAFALHASGYLLKPISREQLAAEVDYVVSGRLSDHTSHILVQTFGNFDVFVDGKLISFTRSKAKELLAYLVDRQGSGVNRAEAFSILWEDTFYDRSMQKQMDVVVRSLRSTLQENAIGEMIEIKAGIMRVVPTAFECDLYRFLAGEPDAVNAYRGEYMSAYSWATMTEAYLDGKKGTPKESENLRKT